MSNDKAVQQSVAGHIWDTMSRVNVNEHIEKKGNLSYLSWSWAWSELVSRFPDSGFEFSDRKFDDGTMEVTCTLTVYSGENHITRHMWLPVMDNRNNAIANPNARQVSDTKMRCLVKTIAITTGLGLYIYAGEDLPQAEAQAAKSTISAEQSKLIGEAIMHAGADMAKILKHYKVNKLGDLTGEQYEQLMHTMQKRIAESAATEQ